MPSKQRDAVKSDISPVLFMSTDGVPMSFFLRPGPVKRKLGPLITAGGGMLCNVQQPGAILLIDPEERGTIAETTAHWYVSMQYIQDCIERDEQLNLEDYRLNPEVVQRHSARLNNNKERSPGLSGGRVAYTAEEDAAILDYVSKHKTEIGGNRLWQEMAKQHVTTHSWQSMKYRYRVRLAKKQSEVMEEATTEENPKAAEEETKVEGKEKDVEKPSSAEDAVAPQTHSAESDLTQIADQSIPAESMQPEIVETRETVETETSNCPQPEGACLDPPTDAQPIPAESRDPEADEPQTSVSPQKGSVPEDPQPECLSDTSSQKKPKGKQKAPPRLEQPQRRSTRRQLQLEESFSSDPYGKKLRSSSSSAEQPSSSPQPLKKTEPALMSALQKDTTVDQPPSKKARGEPAVVESQQEETGQATVSETTQADTESKSTPQREEKKKEKRKLGILELATKEFEDESESDDDEDSDPQNATETATVQPTSTEAPLPAPDAAASTKSNPEPGPDLQENVQETQTPSNNCPPPAEPAASEPAAINKSSKAHLFIFENESQEEDSQSIIGDSTAAPAEPQPAVNKDAAYSLTQVQLEEDMQRIRELMKETNQDLVSVTKALLKTSGDPDVRQQLLKKYGEREVAKRIMFLELEG